MKIGILGTGIVGNTIGKKLNEFGHEVMMGSRNADNPKLDEFRSAANEKALTGTFSDAAKFGELIFNCTKGQHAVEACKLAGSASLKNKVLVDVSNPLDFSNGFPPTLTVCNTDSIGEQLQKALPETHVVKALNTMNCEIMLEPSRLTGTHDVFICGNNNDAKKTVSNLLQEDAGWHRVIDLGDISNSRGTEMLLPIWVRLYGKYQHGNFNFHINGI